MKDNDPRVVLSAQVRALRERHGMSREVLATLSNMSAAGIISIELHRRWPRVENLVAIASAFGTPWQYLFGMLTAEGMIRAAAADLGYDVELRPKPRKAK